MLLNPYFSGVQESQEKLDSRLVSKSNLIWRSCHGDALMERFHRLTFLKRLTLKENAKLICNRQKFHLWVYHRYKTCRNAQTLKVSINALPVKDFQMRLFFKNSTSNLIFDGNSRRAEKIMKPNWWNQNAVTQYCYTFSFFDALKNRFALFQHNASNHPL